MLCKNLGMYWPVGAVNTRQYPHPGQPGSFWQNRGDRHHAGVDLYAPANSPVYAIQTGRVLAVSIFTSPGVLPYWNTTYSILLQLPSGIILRYAELGQSLVAQGDVVLAGQMIGKVGEVLMKNRVTTSDPQYIQDLKNSDHSAMLHFEVYSSPPEDWNENYLGGNYFGYNDPPPFLLDPGPLLDEILASGDTQSVENQVY